MTAPTVAPASSVLDRYEAVIGIEVHCQLRTVSKMFCGCSTDYDGAAPNTHCCPVCLGLPGALPTINRRAVEHVIATGLAIDASIPDATRWDRKNYFYPDLPKGYQISQYDLPLASRGRLAIETSDGPFTVGIHRAHLEEDTAKLIHAAGADGGRVSLVDFNRSGAPLMEIVTEPDIRTAEQARRYAEELQLLLRAIGASDAEMENGQMRVEANVSLRLHGAPEFGTRVEVKNMNSFRSVERAIGYEIERQAAALDAGEAVHMETRGWDDGRQSTYHMRPKEQSDDYRYFPEPDLPPLHVEAAWLETIRGALPELPAARRERYRTDLKLNPYFARILTDQPRLATFFDAAIQARPDVSPESLANWVMGQVVAIMKAKNLTDVPLNPGEFAALVQRVDDGRLSGANAKTVILKGFESGEHLESIVTAEGFEQISDTGALGAAVDAAIAANPAAVADYRAGKAQAVGFLVGQVMKATRGQADAARVQQALRERLDAEEG